MQTIIIKSLMAVLKRMLAAAVSKKMLEYVIFTVAEIAVERTDTKHDDAWLEEFKKAFKEAE